MAVEMLNYADLAARLQVSPEAARALAKRLRLPRSRGSVRRIGKRHVWCVAIIRERQMVVNMENITPPGTPAKRALAALDNPPPADATAPAKRISKRVRRAIDLMVSGDCKQIKDAAEKVGLACESLSRALSTAHVAEHLRQKVFATLPSPQRAPAPLRANSSTATTRWSATAQARLCSGSPASSRPPRHRSISTSRRSRNAFTNASNKKWKMATSTNDVSP
jgi:hypothetical protein